MGAGADIWNNADEFRYAYKTLDGDGSMIARVVDKGTGSNEWAKGGVMIRQSIAAGSTHAYMPLIAHRRQRRQLPASHRCRPAARRTSTAPRPSPPRTG